MRSSTRLLVPLLLSLAVPASANECAFVAASGRDMVSVIDVGNDRITGFLPVGARPAGLALSGDGRLWVANTEAETVTVLDLSTRRAVAAIPVGSQPTRVAVHPDGGRIYVTERGSARVSVLDAESYQVVDTIGTQGDGPAGIAITRDGRRAWVANSFSSSVVEIDLDQGRVLGGAAVGSLPFELALAPDDSHVYVANAEAGSVSVVRTADRAVVGTIPVGGFPTGAAVHPHGHKLYVANAPTGSVAVIDTATNTLETAIFLGPEEVTELTSLALSSDGARGFTPDYVFANLFAFDTARAEALTFASLGGNDVAPEGMTVARLVGRCPISPDPLLTAPAGELDTTIYLERADLLPVAGTLRIERELLTYDGRHLRQAVLNAQRGAGGTSAAAHAAGQPAQLVGQRGDANCDGSVAAADLAALARQAPSAWRPCGADLDRDGVITPADAALLVEEIFVVN